MHQMNDLCNHFYCSVIFLSVYVGCLQLGWQSRLLVKWLACVLHSQKVVGSHLTLAALLCLLCKIYYSILMTMPTKTIFYISTKWTILILRILTKSYILKHFISYNMDIWCFFLKDSVLNLNCQTWQNLPYRCHI